MRRAFIAVLAAAGLAGAFAALPEPAVAGDRDGYYDRRCDCYGSSRGYWERPGDRRHYRRYNRPHYRDHGTHYYPGYGYYPGRGAYRDRDRHDGYDRGRYGDHRGGDRSAWCARRYRSYDWRTGTYVTYDGRVRYCG